MMFNCNPDFFAAVWRLGGMNACECAPSNSLAFPVHDIAVRASGEISVNFFNCLGADALLPHYLLELALRSQAFFDFVSLFNQGLYQLYNHLLCEVHPLAGFAKYQALEQCFKKPLNSVNAIKCFLKEILGNIPFILREYAACWFPIAEKTGLGEGADLTNTLLGGRFFSRQFSVALNIGPVPAGCVPDLLVLKSVLGKLQKTYRFIIKVDYAEKGFHLSSGRLGEYLESDNQRFIL